MSISKSGSITITSYDADNPCTIKNMEQDTDDRNNLGRIFTVTGGELRLQDIILDGGRDLHDSKEDDRKEETTEQASLSEYIELSAQNDRVGQTPQTTQELRDTQNPQTGSYILWLCAAAVLCALCMIILTFLRCRYFLIL